MEIAQATKADIPQMVQLLKLSLGDSLVPKSEQYFIWKHELNPFGKSYINIAREGDEIIGLRTFMRWHFRKGDEIVTAVRAVDTATHPQHQGKGIFKKLTLRAVDDCIKEGVGMVFNTPNNQSRPGYLKMGWQDAGRMPVIFRPGKLFPRRFDENHVSVILQKFSLDAVCTELEGESFPVPKSVFHSPLSLPYISWRFRDCPVVKYGGMASKGSYGIIFRLKPLKSFIELRICEQWAFGRDGLSEMQQALGKIINAVRPVLITAAPCAFIAGNRGFFGPFAKGPQTTLRQLNYSQLDNFAGFKTWLPSIGAMELF